MKSYKTIGNFFNDLISLKGKADPLEYLGKFELYNRLNNSENLPPVKIFDFSSQMNAEIDISILHDAKVFNKTDYLPFNCYWIRFKNPDSNLESLVVPILEGSWTAHNNPSRLPDSWIRGKVLSSNLVLYLRPNLKC